MEHLNSITMYLSVQFHPGRDSLIKIFYTYVRSINDCSLKANTDYETV